MGDTDPRFGVRPVARRAPHVSHTSRCCGQEGSCCHESRHRDRPSTADPELRSASTGKKVCTLRLAILRRQRTGEDPGAVFVDVVVFEGLAVACAATLRKSSKVLIDGRLEHRTWQTCDGSKRSRHEVIAHEVTFLDAPPARTAHEARNRDTETPTGSSETRSATALAA